MFFVLNLPVLTFLLPYHDAVKYSCNRSKAPVEATKKQTIVEILSCCVD